MKKFITLFLAFIATTALWAADFTVDGIAYNKLGGDSVEVTSGGSYSGFVTIPASVTYESTTYRVTSIGGGAFESCKSLSSITIPNSVTSIGNDAFNSCTSLSSIYVDTDNTHYASIDGVLFNYAKDTLIQYPIGNKRTTYTIPNSVTSIGDDAFYYCKSLSSVTIPNSVTSIGVNAFRNCTKLSSITIPNSVTNIGWGAFESCHSLSSVTIPNSVTSIGDEAFQGCTSLPVENNLRYADTYLVEVVDKSLSTYAIKEGTKWIGSSAFYSCDSLTSITIPNSVTSIGDYAFQSCRSLSSVTIPSSVTSIGDDAFGHCTSLSSVTIPNSVTSIGSRAFQSCASLSSITIPNSVTSIGYSAFYGCDSLSSIDVDAANTHYASVDGVLFNYAKDTLIQYPIGNTRTSYTIPNSVTSIGSLAFFSCDSLSSVTIPNSVTSIGGGAFSYCKSLSSITIPNSVTSIGDAAFWGCTSLSSVTCYATTPPTCGGLCFYYVTKSIPVYMPEGSTDAYKAADGWKDFTNFIPMICKTVTTSVNNPLWGSVSGGGIYYDSICTLTATANYGYHFTQWNDGNTDNPRSIVVIQDTTFEAIFDKDTFTITTAVNYPERGITKGDTSALYLDTITLTATANYGYHFTQWNDGNTSNARQVQVTEDKIYTAQFDKNQYTVSTSKDANMASVTAGGTYYYLEEIVLTATANVNYQFDHWSDGNTDNPRTVIVTQDTSLTAFSSKIRSGQCGNNLYWQYSNAQLTITGTGTMYNYTQDSLPWILFRDSITSIVIDNGATSIGDYAFYGCANKNLKKIDLPNSVTTIGQYAFANCTYLKYFTMGTDMAEIKAKAFDNDQKLLYVTCYTLEPPTLATDAFVNWDAYLSVPCEAVADYKVSVGWKLFNKDNVTCIGAEPTTTDKVIVTPDDNSVTITWPTTEGADSYTIIINKGGEPFCTLTFNAQGQLINIAFAPGRGANNAVAATAVAGGYRFTVTNLDSGTNYTYEIDTQDAEGTSIANYSGSFTTTGGTPTAIDQTSFPSGEDRGEACKIIKNGQLYILRDGKMYNAQGGEL